MAIKRSWHTFRSISLPLLFFFVESLFFLPRLRTPPHIFSIRPSRSLIRAVSRLESSWTIRRKKTKEKEWGEEGWKWKNWERHADGPWNRKWYFEMWCTVIMESGLISPRNLVISSVLWKWVFFFCERGKYFVGKLANVWIRGVNGLSIRFFSPSFGFLEGWIFSFGRLQYSSNFRL